MDPMTLFTLANGAVAAVKGGCKLYNDIKNVSGDVKDVLKDLDKQFKEMHKGGPVPAQARKQLQEEKRRVVELSKTEPSDVYDQIGEQLGVYFENYSKCLAVFEEEERVAKQVYKGDVSVARRALQRVLIQSKLEQMGVELRELMVYQSPKELGDLFTRVEEMMKRIEAEQKRAITRQMKMDRERELRRRAELKKLHQDIILGIGALAVTATVGVSFLLVVEQRIEKYPHLGTEWIPKSESQRVREAKPQVWSGR